MNTFVPFDKSKANDYVILNGMWIFAHRILHIKKHLTLIKGGKYVAPRN